MGRNFCVKGVILNPHTSRKGASPRTSGTCVTFFFFGEVFCLLFFARYGCRCLPDVADALRIVYGEENQEGYVRVYEIATAVTS